jgi:hypothetical protein
MSTLALGTHTWLSMAEFINCPDPSLRATHAQYPCLDLVPLLHAGNSDRTVPIAHVSANAIMYVVPCDVASRIRQASAGGATLLNVVGAEAVAPRAVVLQSQGLSCAEGVSVTAGGKHSTPDTVWWDTGAEPNLAAASWVKKHGFTTVSTSARVRKVGGDLTEQLQCVPQVTLLFFKGTAREFSVEVGQVFVMPGGVPYDLLVGNHTFNLMRPCATVFEVDGCHVFIKRDGQEHRIPAAACTSDPAYRSLVTK